MKSCLFCQIVADQQPAKIITQSESAVVIADINPKAPVHLLVLPKIHYRSPEKMPAATVKDIFALANTSARMEGIERSGYRLVINVGPDSGQEIDHLHLHVLGGRSAEKMF